MAAAELGANQCLIKLIEYGCDVGQVDNNQFDTLCYCLVDQTEHHLECLRTCLAQDEQVFKNSMSLLKAIEKGEGMNYESQVTITVVHDCKSGNT